MDMFPYFTHFAKFVMQLILVNMAKAKHQKNQKRTIKIKLIAIIKQSILESEQYLDVQPQSIGYEFIKGRCIQFLINLDEKFQESIYLVRNSQQLDDKLLISSDFNISVQDIINNMDSQLIIMIKRVVDQIQEKFENEIKILHQRIQFLQQQIETFKKPTLSNFYPRLHSKSSYYSQTQAEKLSEDVQLDIAILFSQPLYNKDTKNYMRRPVDFRGQIQRLRLALESSYKTQITMQCQIATIQSLRNIIKHLKPKILHIICHGDREGNLQFQQDSRIRLGSLQLLKPSQLRQKLKNQIQHSLLPKLVFVNSCHSEIIGKSFFDIGVNNVVMINSADTITDAASHFFSDNFYRNLFRGESFQKCFENAKQSLKKTSINCQCCCFHSSSQIHRPDCTTQKKLKRDSHTFHKNYHVPGAQCKCKTKASHFHEPKCKWAQKILLQINPDFRVKMEGENQIRFPRYQQQFPQYFTKQWESQLIICCCPAKGMKPHSQSQKFKKLTRGNHEILFNDLKILSKPEINDRTASQLIQAHDKSKLYYPWRQVQLFDFIEIVTNVKLVRIFGKAGVGITTFAIKACTYMQQRRLFEYFFFLDLYDMSDQVVFRYKFNQITRLDYSEQQINQEGIKNRKVLFLFDNCDAFINSEKSNQFFYNFLTTLIKQIKKCKIIITFKTETKPKFSENYLSENNQKQYELKPLVIDDAERYLQTKLRDKTELMYNYKQLIRKYPSLQIPKTIQSLSQSLPSQNQINLEKIEQLVQAIKSQDPNKLILLALEKLYNKSKQAYQFLTFTSQFSEGVTFQDISIFASYFKDNAKIQLPIRANWQKHYLMLFQKTEQTKDLKQTQLDHSQSETQHSLSLDDPRSPKRKDSQFESRSKSMSKFEEVENVKGESYFVEKYKKQGFIVKRFIRDIIWRNHQNETTNQNKFLYICYFSVILEIMFSNLKEKKLFHEDINTFSSISSSGIFSNNTTLSSLVEKKFSLTESMYHAKTYATELYDIFSNNHKFIEKLKKTDHITFIQNHQHDLLKIFDIDWANIVQYLKNKNKKQEKGFIFFFENLMIYIPTAFIIINANPSLVKYVIKKSKQQLGTQYMTPSLQNQRRLKIKLKLGMIEVGVSLKDEERVKEIITQIRNILQEAEDKQRYKVSQSDLKQVKKTMNMERLLINILLKLNSQSNVTQNYIKDFIAIFKAFCQEYNQISNDCKICAKQIIVFGEISLRIYQKIKSFQENLKKSFNQTFKLIKQLLEHSVAENLIQPKEYPKLCMKMKILIIQMEWSIFESFPNKSQGSQLQVIRSRLEKCQKFLFDDDYGLKGFTQFETKIKGFKQKIKQQLWKFASKRMIFMKAFPICSGDYPILKNLIRRKNNFRQQIQKIIIGSHKDIVEKKIGFSPGPTLKTKDSKITSYEQQKSYEICTKYEILTGTRIITETEAKCSIMFITADVKIVEGDVYIVCQDELMQQQLIEVNERLINNIKMQNLRILVLSGIDTHYAMNKIVQKSENPPIIISLSSKSDELQQQFMQDIEDFSSDKIIRLIRRQNECKKSQLQYTKEFISKIITSQIKNNNDVLKFHNEGVKKMKEMVPQNRIQAHIYLQKCKNVELVYKEGVYQDLSPGYEGNHNIDSKSYQNTISILRWKKMLQLFKQLSRQSQYNENESRYVNVFGDVSCGKTSFIKEIAKILVQRQSYDYGVFLLEGKRIQNQCSGDFQKFINKQSNNRKMPKMQDFQNLLNEKTILIVDDFHLIRSRVNARLKLFLDKIIQRRVNLILVSVKQLHLDTLPEMKRIYLEPLDNFESEFLIYNIIDVTNAQQIKSFEQFKKKCNENKKNYIKQIGSIPEFMKTHRFISQQGPNMKKRYTNTI